LPNLINSAHALTMSQYSSDLPQRAAWYASDCPYTQMKGSSWNKWSKRAKLLVW